MRKIDILNKNYEVANLNTVVYEGYSIKEIIENSPVFDVTPPQHYLDYWQKIYDYLKDGTQLPGHTYIPSGQSKYDIAYVNKTNDDLIVELDNHSLKDIFENGNLQAYGGFDVDTDSDGIADNLVRGSNIVEYSWLNGIQSFTGVGSWSYTFSNRVAINGNIFESSKYYFVVIRAKRNNSIGTNRYWLSVAGSQEIASITLTTEYQEYFAKFQTLSALTQFTSAISAETGLQTSTDYMKVYSMSAFNIGHLTLEQMQSYYLLYKSRKDITKKYLTYADIFEWYQSFINPQFEDGTNGWSYYLNGGNPNLIVNNGIGSYSSNQYAAIGQNDILNSTDKFYVCIKAKSSLSATFNAASYENTSIGKSESLGNLSIEFQIFSKIYNNFGITHTKFGFGRSNVSTMIDVDFAYIINIKYFDESISKEQLDLLLSHYLTVKDIVIYPENFIPLEPTGFGNRYKFKELNTKVYGHEMDFEKMQLNLLFGTYRNAYESFNLLTNFMINNEAIISYDYGKGIRYTDVRLIAAPKTELDNGQHMRSKFDFKRLSPFYTIEEGSALTIENVHDWDIKPIISGSVNTNIVYIEAEETTSGIIIGVKFDFTSLTKPFNFYYNAETKQILINGINNGYQYIDFSYGVSFITLPKDTEHIVWTTGITSPIVKAKKWVID